MPETEYHFTQFMDRYKGAVGLVVATGPGLSNVPEELLEKYPSFSFNSIVAKHPEFCPTFYHNMGFNHLDTAEKREIIFPLLDDDRCEAVFINRLFTHHFRHPKTFSIMGPGSYGIAAPDGQFVFSPSPFDVIGLAACSVYLSIQMAVYMGFGAILIVGMDSNYGMDGAQHFHEPNKRYEFERGPGPHYNNDPATWFARSEAALSAARRVCETNGVRLLNLSQPTACKVLEKDTVEGWL